MKIICFGDSNTYGYDPRSIFGSRYDSCNRWVEILGARTGWQVCNMGENGREIPRSPVSFPQDTDLLILMLGTNDILTGWTPRDASGKMERFIRGLELSREKLLLIIPPPVTRGSWVPNRVLIDACVSLGRYYRELAADLGIAWADAGEWNIPMAYDGVHFTEQGHGLFAEELLKLLTK